MDDCFLKVRAHIGTNPVLIKSRILLKAIDRTIEAKSPENYFKAVLQLLQGLEDQVHQEAAVLLLACVLKTVPKDLIQEEFEFIKRIVDENVQKDSAVLAKCSIKVLEVLVMSIDEEDWLDWECFEKLTDLVLDKKVELRKQACLSLEKVLRKGLIGVCKVKSYLIGRFLQIFEMRSGNVEDETFVYCFEFLNVFLILLQLDEVSWFTGKIVEIWVKRISSLVIVESLLLLKNLFVGFNFTGDIVYSYLTDLLSAPVVVGSNEDLQVAYIQCITQGLIYLSEANSKECYMMMSQIISVISEFLFSGQSKVQHAACDAIKAIIIRCIKPNHLDELDPNQGLLITLDVLNIHDLAVKTIQRVNVIMIYLFNERFAEILEIIFPVVDAYLKQLGKNGVHIVSSLFLVELDGLALRWYDNKKFKELMASFVNIIGCETFFNVLPLRLNCVPIESENFLESSRSWILKVISDGLEIGDILYPI